MTTWKVIEQRIVNGSMRERACDEYKTASDAFDDAIRTNEYMTPQARRNLNYYVKET